MDKFWTSFWNMLIDMNTGWHLHCAWSNPLFKVYPVEKVEPRYPGFCDVPEREPDKIPLYGGY